MELGGGDPSLWRAAAGMVWAGATIDKQKWDQHSSNLFSKLGNADAQANGKFRAFVAGTSICAATFIGLLAWNANRLVKQLDDMASAVGKMAENTSRLEERISAQQFRQNNSETAMEDIQRQVREALQRISRTEGRLEVK